MRRRMRLPAAGWNRKKHLVSCCSILVAALHLAQAVSLENALREPKLELSKELQLQRRDFIKRNSFPLSEQSIKLLGAKFAPEAARRSHLPFWFDFDHYKKVYRKSYPSEAAEREHHLTYLRTCLRVLRRRVLYRILGAEFDAVIDDTADWLEMPKDDVDRAAAAASSGGGDGANVGPDPLEVESIHLNFNGVDQRSPLAIITHQLRIELDHIESRNQLVHYLAELNEVVERGPAAMEPHQMAGAV